MGIKNSKGNQNFIANFKEKFLAKKTAKQLQKQQKLAVSSSDKEKKSFGGFLQNSFVTMKKSFQKLLSSCKKISLKKSLQSLLHSKKKKTAILAILVFIVFVISMVSLCTHLGSFVEKHESKMYYVDDQGIKYLEIDNGFITEKLIVESGDILPTIQDYFSENYEIQKDATISYFEGKNGISIESFTFEKEGNVYVRGIREIDVVIHNGKEYATKLIIKDTKDPYVTLQDLTITEGESLDPESFVSLYVDDSQIQEHTSYFPESINYSTAGVYDVTIKVCDLGNNCVEGVSKLTVRKGEASSANSSGNNKNQTSPSKGSSSGSGSGSSSSSKPSSSGSSGSSSSGNSSHTQTPSQGNSTPAPRVFVKTVTEENGIYKYDDHYGARLNYYAYSVTYNLYSDGYKEVTNIQGHTYTLYDPKGYVGNFTALKKEALTYISNNSSVNNAASYFLTATNKKRAEKGVSALVLNDDLNKIAQIRAMEIAYSQIGTDSKGNHIRPDGSSFSTIFTAYGYKATIKGENFVSGGTTISNYDAFTSLVGSSSHLANMVNGNYTKMGVGKFNFNGKIYWVQLFSN